MQTDICQKLGAEIPVFAFSHCRDVVVEVTKAGGFGVLGAVTFSPEQLEHELAWIDSHVDGRAYGVDVLIPAKYDEAAETSSAGIQSLLPDEQRSFVEDFMAREGVPEFAPDQAETCLPGACRT